MKSKKILLSLFSNLILIAILVLPFGCNKSVKTADAILEHVLKNIENEFKLIDIELSNAAKELSGLEPAGSRAREILAGLVHEQPYAIDACTVDRYGKIIALEPQEYSKFEGSDISSQEQVIRLFRTQGPVLSDSFETVEGIHAADFEYPIFLDNGEISGAVSLLIKPEILLGTIITKETTGTPYTIWGMQRDGRIIYDIDPAEVGLNLFMSPVYRDYPELINLGREISEKASGSGRYSFLNTGLQQTVNKAAAWTTFSLYGTEWRLVLIHVVS